MREPVGERRRVKKRITLMGHPHSVLDPLAAWRIIKPCATILTHCEVDIVDGFPHPEE
jgi:hypothetical protein